MSPQIDLGMNYNAADEEGKRQREPLDEGTYTLKCISVELTQSAKKRPQLKFEFEVEGKGKKLMYWAPLPDGDNYGGIGFLVDVTNALGKPWNGTMIDTEDYPGCVCQANIVLDGEYNKIKSFV